MDKVQQYIALISDPDPGVREKGATLLALAGLPLNQAEYNEAIAPAIPQIIALLDDKESGVRKASVITLAKLSLRELGETIVLAIPRIITLLSDQEPGTRQASASILESLSYQDTFRMAIIPAIRQITALLIDQESGARQASGNILENLSNRAGMELQKAFAPTIPQFIALLNDQESDAYARGASGNILRNLSNQAGIELQKAFAPTIPQFIALLNVQEFHARQASGKILENLSNNAGIELQKAFAPTIPQFIALLNVQEFHARQASGKILENLSNNAVIEFQKAFAPTIPQFIALLNGREFHARQASGKILENLSNQAVIELQKAFAPTIPQFIALLNGREFHARQASGKILENLSNHAGMELQKAFAPTIPQFITLRNDQESDAYARGASGNILRNLSNQAGIELQKAFAPTIPQFITLLNDQGSGANARRASVNILENLSNQEATTYWIAAEHALEHARSKMSPVSKVFDRWQIPTSEYAILVGFDESLIQSGIGYLEQIHVFLSESAEAIATSHPQLLTELGKLFSPFSSVLFTESSSRYLSVFNDDGTVWDFDELVYYTALKFSDGGASSKMPLVGISFSQNSIRADGSSHFSQGGSGSGSGEGGSNEKRASKKGEKRDRVNEDSADKEGNSDKDPGDNPEDPSGNQGTPVAEPGEISFEINSKIYPAQAYSQNTFQTITMLGCLTIKTTPLSLAERPYQFSERRVQFKGLAFDSTPPTTEAAYRQFHVVVVVDSQQEQGCVAHILSITPKTTKASDSEEKEMKTVKNASSRSGTVALNLGAVTHGLISGNATKTNEETVGTERKRYSSAITAHRTEGTVRWGFNIDDVNMQTWGIDMEDILPSASFRFHGNSNKPAPPPKSMVTMIASHWSIILPSEPKRTWIRKLLDLFGSSANTGAISYSNMFQIVALKVDTSKLELEPYHYKANLEVRSGISSFKPLGEVSGVDVTPEVVDDLLKLRYNLPTIGQLRLSDNYVHT